LLRVHGVKRTDGQVGVLLINDDPSNSTTVTVGISGATLATTGTQYTFGNANFASGASTPSSGISSKSISGVGSSFNITVPAYTTVAVLIPQSSTNSSNLIANGTYVIANNHSELVLDDTGWSTQQGTNMDQWSPTGGNNQKWTLTNLGNNYVELLNATSGLALDISGASTASGAAVIQWPYHSGSNQIWRVVSKGNGLYELLNQNSGLALSVPRSSTSNGTDLDQETVTGAANQLWSFSN
jgi:Ricin-type beta-trefoil lectin domain-like